MTISIRRGLTWALALGLLAAVLSPLAWRALSPVKSQPADGQHTFMSIDGLQLPFEVKRYAKLADLVIVGTPVSDEVHSFTENASIPEWAKSDEMYATAGYHDVTIQVAEYVKGKGPEAISIRRLAPPPDVSLASAAPVPTLDQQQVMFLQEGTGLWTGGYLILGEQSLADLVNDIVKFKSGKEQRLDEFRKDVKSADEDKQSP